MDEQIPPPSNEDKLESPPKYPKSLHGIFILIQIFVLIGTALYLLDSGNYGWTLFCAIPFSIGVTIGTYTRTFKSKKFLKGSLIALVVIILLCIILLAVGFEGAICILMAIGLLVLPTLFGVVIGYWLRSSFKIYSISVILLLNTSSMVYDGTSGEQVNSIATESIIINAPKEKIWNVLTNPVSFSKRTNVFFKSGVSYPTEMFLSKEPNNCYLLNCKYNNGQTKLVIERLDSLKCMRFSMKEEITTMKEMTFYEQISAPHLKGYFKPNYGEFLISEISPGRCKLTATTSYSYKIKPAFYWHWWTDYLANEMHHQVLADIKRLSE